MKHTGFTLYELIITVAIIAITLSIATPAFNKTIQNTRTKTATLALLDAIETTRSTAVFHNQTTILVTTKNKWHEGWTLFVDNNNNRALDVDDKIINISEGLDAVITKASERMSSHIAFIGTGEGRQIPNGGLLLGNVIICPQLQGEGYKLLLSKGGRTRVEKLSSAACDAARQS